MSQSNSPTLGPSSAAVEVELQIASELAAQAEVLPDKPTKYMTELIQKPRIRGVFLRHGKTLQFNRTTNKDAILAFTRGEVAVPACTSCEAGAGPFTECIHQQQRNVRPVRPDARALGRLKLQNRVL